VATTFKALSVGNVLNANTTTTVYTVPTDSKTIIKSFIITNSSASGVTVIVRLAGTEILFNYIIKPYDTIVVPAMDQCIDITNGTISIYASAGNSISYYISGIETLLTDTEYSDVSRLGHGVLPTYPTYNFLFGSTSKNRLVKGLILCNTNSTDARVYLSISGFSILPGFTIKSYDTIIVPTTDLLLPASQTISGSGAGVNYYITGKDV
jgi:hypothetical protein